MQIQGDKVDGITLRLNEDNLSCIEARHLIVRRWGSWVRVIFFTYPKQSAEGFRSQIVKVQIKVQ